MLTPEHVVLLAAGAIPEGVALAAGAYSVSRSDGLPPGLSWSGPGIVFRYHPLDGAPVPQYRPDTPTVGADGRLLKYVFPKGDVPLNVVPAMRDRVGTADRVLFVEGTKQTLAAVAHAPADTLVVGVAGCWGWCSKGQAVPELGRLGVDGRPVVVAFDADYKTNRTVHDAASRLAEHLECLGAESVRFVDLPASGKVGLDDFLGSEVDPAAMLGRLLDRAKKLRRLAKRTAPNADLISGDGIQAAGALERLRETTPLLVDKSGQILTYADGVFRADRQDAAAWDALVTGLLTDAYRPAYMRTLTEYAAGRLRAEGMVAVDAPHPGLVNVRNGMLDALTGQLHPHDPSHRSIVQFAVGWVPSATCPTFDEWLQTVVPLGLIDDLLEAVSLVLETRLNRAQRRALFLHGPARSGKSTFLRILEWLVGPHRSAVTLSELASDKFAAADLVGSILNSAADLSANHLDDLSMFKSLTGDDDVRAQRKYGAPFRFRNQALFVFSANAIPTAGETSAAYLGRIRPIPFPYSFAGHEDATIEDRIAAELEGVFVRLVHAYRAHTARGAYLDNDDTRLAADHFARSSDRVRLFLSEATDITPDGWVLRKDLRLAFDEWCQENRRQPLGTQRFYAVIESAGFKVSARHGGDRGFAGINLRQHDDWDAPDDPFAVQKVQFIPSPPSCGGNGEKGEEKAGGKERGGSASFAPPVGSEWIEEMF